MKQAKIDAIMDGNGIKTIVKDGDITRDYVANYDPSFHGYNFVIHSGKKGQAKDSRGFDDFAEYEKAIKEIAPLSSWKLV